MQALLILETDRLKTKRQKIYDSNVAMIALKYMFYIRMITWNGVINPNTWEAEAGELEVTDQVEHVRFKSAWDMQ